MIPRYNFVKSLMELPRLCEHLREYMAIIEILRHLDLKIETRIISVARKHWLTK